MQPGEPRQIARAISTVENQSDGYEAILAQAYRLPRWAEVIGVTGPPGVGKSTLVDALTAHWAQGGERVAVLAIDPSSPYSGGAVLGDRIRRVRSGSYDNTYFRSLSSRGHVGGLSATATDLVAVLSLHRFSRVIIETVGAGQSDIEIQSTADCTVVVTVPGLGDGVQASKAGMMEIGDVFAVNKADLPGADLAARTIENALSAAYMGTAGVNAGASPATSALPSAMATPGIAALQRRHGDIARDTSVWVPPVLPVVATEGRHIAELARVIHQFLGWSDSNGRRADRSRERAYAQILRALTTRLLAPYTRPAGTEQWPETVADWIDRVASGGASPIEAAVEIMTAQRNKTAANG
ncbi:MAG: methylmalonyl Co-A mutase-associated GTPase MeaB [Pseudolabrys sp.]|nr:methylmalonyl Co-A mutase-associated GTPase MeaB [Pseudolabrys sp.]